MKAKSRQSGLTLIEQTVVIAIVSLLTVFGLPAVRTLFHSLASSGNARAMISAGLASARAIAAKEQRYAGVRFQKAYHPEGPLEAPQYMVFIVQDPEIGAYFFRAVEGLEPIRLPDSVGVMDFTIVTKRTPTVPANTTRVLLDDPLLGGDGRINEDFELRDTTTFSIIFSPSGKLVIHAVRVRNRDDETEFTETINSSRDDIFNTLTKITDPIYPVGMFIQDDYFGSGLDPDLGYGLGPELSRRSFIIYETEIFRQAYEIIGLAYSGYLYRLVPEAIYINPYTGTIISPD